MTSHRSCLLALVFLLSACPRSKDADDPLPDAGSQPGGKGGAGGRTSSGAGGAGSNAGRSGAGSHAGKGGAGSAAESGKGGASEVDADAGSSCSADCAAGEHCELVQVTCVRAPCPPLPMCVPDGAGNEPIPADCDPRKVLCKRTAPECPEGQAPSVEGSCYGDCVDIHACQCTGPEACPLPEKYTCHMSAKHCTPYLR